MSYRVPQPNVWIMRLVPLLAFCLAGPLAAQTPDRTPPDRYYPLGVGDIREYRTTTTSPPRPTSYVRESVVGETTVDGQTYRLVASVSYDAAGAETSRRTRLVRFDLALAVPVERQTNGAEDPLTPCRLDLPFGPGGDACPFYSGSPSETVPVGSDAIVTSVKTFVNLIGDARYAAGLGLYEQNIDEAGTESTTRLHYARIDGVTYGTPDPILPPLPPEPEAYWPLAVGNLWVHRIDGMWPERTWWTVTGTTTVSDTTYALVQACRRDLPGGTPSCLTQPTRVDNRTGRIVAREGAGERLVMCGLLPTADDGPLACDVMGMTQWHLSTAAPATVLIGSASVPTSSLRTIAIPDLTFGFAAGIGPVPQSGLGGVGVFEYARLSGVTYGVNPVAGAAAPATLALALRVSPTPADGPVTIAVAGAASPAAVEAFDALGRRVWQATVAGEAAVDASGWAPGVYVVRATASSGATATARIVRR